MESLIQHSGLAAPLLLDNIDTDQIIPGGGIFATGQITHEQCGRTLFADWRYLPDGSENPDFFLNQPRWRNATILLAGENFGCGSSREWATTALRGYGFRVVVAAGFSAIFFNNCFRNGMLPVRLPRPDVEHLADVVRRVPDAVISVDLEHSILVGPEGGERSFEVPPVLRRMLLDGADEADYAQRRTAELNEFRLCDRLSRPWAYLDIEHTTP